MPLIIDDYVEHTLYACAKTLLADTELNQDRRMWEAQAQALAAILEQTVVAYVARVEQERQAFDALYDLLEGGAK